MLTSLTVACRGVEEQKPAEKAAQTATVVPGTEPVLARVNGVPITELDVLYWLAKNTQGKVTQPTPEQTKNVLEVIIAQELILQRSIELGLDRSAEFQRKLRAKQAELDSFKRTEIRDDFYLHLAREADKGADDEARAYFDRYADRIRSRYHVLQILRSSRSEIEALGQKIAAGMPFEEAAALGAPEVPEGARKPWDAGYLPWLQVPEKWREPLAQLAVGQTSGIIEGTGGRRFWIIKLVDKQTDPEVTFERVREALVTTVKRDRVERMRAEADADLRKRATIVYEELPPAAPEQTGLP